MAGQPGDKLAVAVKKIIIREPVRFLPENLFELIIDRDAGELRDAVEDQFHRRALVVLELVALEQTTNNRLDAQFLAKLAGQRLLRFFTGFDFAAGKLPFETMPIVAFALANQDFSTMCEHAGNHGNHFRHETDSLSRKAGNGGE